MSNDPSSERQASLNKLCENIKLLVRSDRDFVLAISGKTGEGKSTLAQQIAYRVDRKFNIKVQTIFTRQEFIELIKNPEVIPQHSCLIVDEAVNILFKRDFMFSGQKELLKLMDMCRDRNLIIILCIPNFWSLDKHILDSRVRGWIYVEQRGTGLVFVPDENPFAEDKWHRRENEQRLKNWNLGVMPTKSRNYIGQVKYSDLPDDKKNIYLEVKRTKKENAEKYDDKGKEVAPDADKLTVDVLGQLYEQGMLSQKDLRQIGKAGTVAKNYQGLMTKIANRKKSLESETSEISDTQVATSTNGYTNMGE